MDETWTAARAPCGVSPLRIVERSTDEMRMEIAQLDELLDRIRSSSEPPHQLWPRLDDETWFWLNTEGYRRYTEVRRVLPSLPEPDLQARVIGSSGDTALYEGFHAYRLFTELYEQHVGRIVDCPGVLDFGCGWGRIIRFYLKCLPPDRLVGVDQSAALIEVCRATNRWCRFDHCQPLPPLDCPDQTFGLVYAYSVFSHLSEDVHLRWLAELARVLRSGGLLVATTWHRGFIEENAELRTRADMHEPSAWQLQRLITFTDTDRWLEAYDAGAFCYEAYPHDEHPWSYVDGLSFYGEACIPRAYALDHWAERFEIVDFIDDRQRCPQNVIVARKRE